MKILLYIYSFTYTLILLRDLNDFHIYIYIIECSICNFLFFIMTYIISIDFILLYICIDHNFSVIMSKDELLQNDRLDIIIPDHDNKLISFFSSRDLSRYMCNISHSIDPHYFYISYFNTYFFNIVKISNSITVFCVTMRFKIENCWVNLWFTISIWLCAKIKFFIWLILWSIFRSRSVYFWLNKNCHFLDFSVFILLRRSIKIYFFHNFSVIFFYQIINMNLLMNLSTIRTIGIIWIRKKIFFYHDQFLIV